MYDDLLWPFPLILKVSRCWKPPLTVFVCVLLQLTTALALSWMFPGSPASFSHCVSARLTTSPSAVFLGPLVQNSSPCLLVVLNAKLPEAWKYEPLAEGSESLWSLWRVCMFRMQTVNERIKLFTCKACRRMTQGEFLINQVKLPYDETHESFL